MGSDGNLKERMGTNTANRSYLEATKVHPILFAYLSIGRCFKVIHNIWWIKIPLKTPFGMWIYG